MKLGKKNYPLKIDDWKRFEKYNKKKTKNFQPIFPIITQPVRKQKMTEWFHKKEGYHFLH